MRKARGVIILGALLGLCFLSMVGFNKVFLMIARANGWLPATATSISWSPQGEPATFVAQGGVGYKITLPSGKYSSYIGRSRRHEIIYNSRDPSSFFLPNEEMAFAFIFFFFFYLWLAGKIYVRYRRASSV